MKVAPSRAPVEAPHRPALGGISKRREPSAKSWGGGDGVCQEAWGVCDSVGQASCLREEPPSSSLLCISHACQFLCKERGEICPANLVECLRKWLFATLHSVGEVPGSPCALA